jgi:hypothetical protein
MDERLKNAQVLEDAADLLLIHGRCTNGLLRSALTGSFCVVGAVGEAAGVDHWGAYSHPAVLAVADHLGHAPLPEPDAGLEMPRAFRGLKVGDWNDQTEDDDDEVRDTLLLVAKDLRNGAVPA